ncbi:MAG: hypothetical protein FWF06_08065 [Symbiobacteriaceae bacterium]|nr:hypothetical protein [Symbiobacteriaceae bacterium]
MKLIYGTTNEAKLIFMKKRLEPLGIEILGLGDVGAPQRKIVESGRSPLENARIKALAYYHELKLPLFSCDSGLYIDNLPDHRQPGVNIRGDNDHMDDEETIAFYAALAAEFGGKMTARYQNAICLVLDDQQVYEYMGEDIASERFYLVTNPHPQRRKGFPLDSISIHIASGLYYYDRTADSDKYIPTDDGFAAFFQRVLRLK